MKLRVSAFDLSFWQVFAGPRLASELRKGMRGREAAEQPLVIYKKSRGLPYLIIISGLEFMVNPIWPQFVQDSIIEDGVVEFSPWMLLGS
jgi:hypothetical protein